jgi:hypothetical protein
LAIDRVGPLPFVLPRSSELFSLIVVLVGFLSAIQYLLVIERMGKHFGTAAATATRNSSRDEHLPPPPA